MSQPIDEYLDRLLQDPNAPPPDGMDAETAAFVRSLVAAGTVKVPPALRRRMWQRSLDAARARSQTPTFTPSSNGHQVHTFDNHGDEPMAQMTIPASRRAQHASSSQRVGVLTLVAAVALVIIGVMLLTTMRTTPSYLNAPEDPNAAGQLAQSETPTASAPTRTPLATHVRNSEPVVVQYTIQPGDTLLSIMRLFNHDDITVIEQIMDLNPQITSADALPGPGTTILIPLRAPTADTRQLLGSEATALPPTVVRSVVSTATPIPFAGSSGTAGTPQVTVYVVQEGDKFTLLAMQFDTTLQVLAELNPQIDVSSCDLTRLTGGPNCVVELNAGQEINVPFYGEIPTGPMIGTPVPIDPILATPLIALPESTATPLPTAAPR